MSRPRDAASSSHRNALAPDSANLEADGTVHATSDRLRQLADRIPRPLGGLDPGGSGQLDVSLVAGDQARRRKGIGQRVGE